MSLTKEQREENLIKLKNAIDLGTIDNLIRPTHEWGGAYVVITSDENEVFNPETDEVYWADKRPLITYVVTQHAKMLSGLYYYVKLNILDSRDAFLYGFMALLANDYLKIYGDDDYYVPMLKYVIDGIYGYFLYYDWENGMGNETEAFDVMRNYLSDKTTDEEIKKIF